MGALTLTYQMYGFIGVLVLFGAGCLILAARYAWRAWYGH